MFHKERKFEIIKAAMAAYLAGAGPNPFYFAGAVGGEFRLLGGLVKGKCNFDFTVGEKCDIEGGSPFGEDVISQLTPTDNSSDVNVFVAPQLVLNVPADERMEIEEENGRKEIYRISVAEFSITNISTGAKSSYSLSKSNEGRVLTYETDEPLESQTKYKVYAKVAFERLDGNRWVAVYGDDAQPYYEEKLVEFKSGDRPKYILPEHIVYAYPADRQYNYLPDEYAQAYFMVKYDYSYLFENEKPEGYDQKVNFTSFEGQVKSASFSYKTVNGIDGVKFEIDVSIKDLNLKTNTIYNMALVNVPQHTAVIGENISHIEKELKTESQSSEIKESHYEAEGNLELLEQSEIYAVDFRTSSYRTFVEKMGSFDVNNIIPWQHYPYVYGLSSNIYDNTSTAEIFDENDYGNTDYTKRMIQFEVDYSSMPWYTQRVAPAIYENTGLRGFVGNITPPSQPEIVTVEFRSLHLPRLDDTMISSNTRPNKSHYGAITNNVLKYIDEERMSFRTKIANMASRGADVKKADAFMALDNIPELISGTYPYYVKYVLPGKNIVTSKYKINVSYKR